jgi:hypothetical protein
VVAAQRLIVSSAGNCAWRTAEIHRGVIGGLQITRHTKVELAVGQLHPSLFRSPQTALRLNAGD